MSGPNVRVRALSALIDSIERTAFADALLERERTGIDGRDRQLLQELVYGCIRHQGTLDHLVTEYLPAAPNAQRPRVRAALWLGAYQLVYLSRIPVHAAVSETVEALKSAPGFRRAEAGFVNAVLHKVADSIEAKEAEPRPGRDARTVLPAREGYCYFRRAVLPAPDKPDSGVRGAAHLAVKYSHPVWLVRRWLRRFGSEETQLLCAANNETPLVVGRLTSLAPSPDEVVASLAEDEIAVESGSIPGTLVACRGVDLAGSRAAGAGWLRIQDETSTRIGANLQPPRGARVLDLCSAPGGKAAQLLETVGPAGHVVAVDRSAEKIAQVRSALVKLGANFTTHVAGTDPGKLDLGEEFSHVLLDAPCSNTGVLARRVEVRWRLSERSLRSLTSLQLELLEAAYRHLKRGGRLLYATCSIEPEENEEVVAQAAARHPDLEELETRLFLPHRQSGDGGYCSLLLRRR